MLEKDAAAAGFSKSLKKKLLKDAQIAAKKAAKGGGAAPAAPAAPAAKEKPSKPASPDKKATAPPAPVPTGSGVGIAGRAERDIVADLLASIEALKLPAEALSILKANEDALAKALQPTVNGLRNDAYAAGFGAHAHMAGYGAHA